MFELTFAQPTPLDAPPREEIRCEDSPFLVEYFMAFGSGFRCMAYHDEQGKWRNAFNHEELRGNFAIL